jgi:hypothetical protein
MSWLDREATDPPTRPGRPTGGTRLRAQHLARLQPEARAPGGARICAEADLRDFLYKPELWSSVGFSIAQ